MIKAIDTHAHLDEIENPENAIHEALAAGVKAIIAPGQDHQSNCRVMAIAKEYPASVYFALGLHPCLLANMDSGQEKNIISFIEDNIQNAVAIGEIGLDYDKRTLSSTSKDMQRSVFQDILSIAKKYNKPVLIHSRYSWRDCFEITNSTGIDKAVFHWFTGPSDVLEDVIGAGYYVSATPAAEYHKEHRRVIKETFSSRLLLETDCPVAYGRDIRYSARPKDVLRSLNAVAEIKNEDVNTVADIILNTTELLFGICTKNCLADEKQIQ